MTTQQMAQFEGFVQQVEPGLRKALTGHMPTSLVHDALGEAFAYAWEHWAQMQTLDNPGGYLFRVAQSRSRGRLQGALPAPDPARTPDVEPRLVAAMRGLPEQQRSAVWLVHACGWTYREAAEAMGVSTSAVGTHVGRGVTALRDRLGVTGND